MTHFDLCRFKAIPDWPLRNFYYMLAAFNYFFSYSDLIIYPPALFPCSQNWDKARREWQFWLEGKWMMVWGRRWGSCQELTFFFSFGLGWNGLETDSTPTVNSLKQLHFKLMNKSFVFVLERGCQKSHGAPRWWKLRTILSWSFKRSLNGA